MIFTLWRQRSRFVSPFQPLTDRRPTPFAALSSLSLFQIVFSDREPFPFDLKRNHLLQFFELLIFLKALFSMEGVGYLSSLSFFIYTLFFFLILRFFLGPPPRLSVSAWRRLPHRRSPPTLEPLGLNKVGCSSSLGRTPEFQLIPSPLEARKFRFGSARARYLPYLFFYLVISTSSLLP